MIFFNKILLTAQALIIKTANVQSSMILLNSNNSKVKGRKINGIRKKTAVKAISITLSKKEIYFFIKKSIAKRKVNRLAYARIDLHYAR